ncbi:peptidoglycan-binding protein [Lyngbya sp. CCAP 1446/10]|uniref:peptidoglycan-binding domain-containing protein n=1 Tax=Lyngbya sp. CCAP 1446/10 TaxID=439293 RepID=UPI002238F336|nr:peptidoglycan-binding protein [Lyngbya sp. CCAP 1446/10]MCW6052070.1 peptidoglycan-binding protein [Lyngbya sp. CCAP 1446/10]
MALLSLGSSGAEVSKLQEKLIKLGFFSSTASGSFDATTESAVKRFQTQRPWLLTDGVAGPMTLGEIDDSLSILDGQDALKAFASGSISLDMTSLRSKRILSLAIQRRLRGLGLYPGGKLIDGDFGSRSEGALKDFCNGVVISVTTPLQLTPPIADKLLITQQIPSVLNDASKPGRISTKYNDFQKAVGATDAKLGFLDMGAQQSPFKETIYRGKDFLAATNSAGIKSSSPGSISFSNYPNIGTKPTISTSSLNFLGSDITEACICLGHFDGGQLTTSWLGKKALDIVECWSASKIIPILNVLSKVGNRIPGNPSDLILKNTGSAGRQFELPIALIDICSYRIDVPHSNALSATLNAFESNREQWIKNQTGNTKSIEFGGKYGIAATIGVPEIRDRSSGSQILSFQSTATGGNLISAYDLTRFISFVGWHGLLSNTQKLPGISDRGIEQAVIALGTDTARYVDTAISTLGLENVVDSLVVLSKLGFGFSEKRNVTELVYTAFAQFIDRQNPSEPKFRFFALTLRSSQPGPGNAVAIQVDTAIATAVTEIIRRIVTEDFLNS